MQRLRSCRQDAVQIALQLLRDLHLVKRLPLRRAHLNAHIFQELELR